MAKLTLSDLSSITGNEQSAITTINNNSALIETALENTLSRDGTSPNSMAADLDMNSNNILNLPAAVSDTEPVRKQEFDDAIESIVADGVAPNTITNAYLSDMAQNTIKGRITSGTGDPEDLTSAQVKTILGYPTTLVTTSVDNTVPRFDGTAGNQQTSGVTIDDSNNLSGIGDITHTGDLIGTVDITQSGSLSGTVNIAQTGNISGTVNLTQTGYHDLSEISAPSNPASNVSRVYAVDSGGTTTLAAKDSAGAVNSLTHFTQTGTGAVLRTQQSKLGDILNVKDFGAVGDGATDDTLAIQAAIDAADGGTVYFPWTSDGYRLTDTIEFGASLTPSGRAKRLVGEAYVTLFFDSLSNTTDAIVMHWDTLAGIEGLTIDMGNPDTSGATYSDGRDGIRINGGEWGYLDVNVINCGRDGIHFEPDAAFSWHENFNGKMRVFNCGRDALHFRLADFNAVFINECRFQLFEARRWKRHAIHAVVNTQSGTYSAAKMSSMGFENINLDANRSAADMTATDLVYFETDAGAPSGGLFDNWTFAQGGWENVTEAMTGRGVNMDAGVTVSDLQMGPIVFFNVDPGATEIDRMVNLSRLTLPYWLRCGTSGGDRERHGPHEIRQPASAVNGIELLATSTGVSPSFVARGGDANVGFNMTTKGGGTLNFSVNNFATACIQGLTSPAGGVQFPSIGTTASAANAFLDSGNSNRLLRSTSSVRYKRGIEPLEDDYADAVLSLNPCWYRSKAEHDNPDWSWYGLVAEEVAKIDPRLVHWAYFEDDYELIETGIPEGQGPKFEKRVKEGAKKSPDGVMYERLSVLLLSVIQRMEKRIKVLESK